MTLASPPKPDASIDWRVVAGIATPDVPNWKRVRVAQLAELARLLPLTFLAFIVSAATVAWLFSKSVPVWQLAGWLGSVVIVMGSAVHMVRRARPTAFGEPHMAALLRGGWRGLALGMLWMLPALLFASGGSLEQQLAICLVCAAMMAVATITTAAVPGVLIAYLAPVAIGLSLMLSRTGSPVLTVLPIVYAPMLGAGGIVSGRALIARQWAEYALEEKSEVVRLLLREFEDAGADWLWQVDSAKRLVGVSPRLARAAGRSPAELEGMPLLDLLADNLGSGVNSRPLRLLVETMNARESFSDLQFEVRVGEETRWWSLSASPRNDGNGDFRRLSRGRIRHHRTSPLGREDRPHGALRCADRSAQPPRVHGVAAPRGRPCAERASALRAAADRPRQVQAGQRHARPSDRRSPAEDGRRAVARHRGRERHCGRLGGDEFAIVLGRVEPGAIERLGGDIIAALGTPFEIDGHIIRIGASVGSAMAPRDGRSVETLIRNADLALYRAKDEGRGTLRRYDPSMLVQAERRRAIETALREALDKGDQFRLMYQPWSMPSMASSRASRR
jgi:PAS domain-containing protein